MNDITVPEPVLVFRGERQVVHFPHCPPVVNSKLSPKIIPVLLSPGRRRRLSLPHLT